MYRVAYHISLITSRKCLGWCFVCIYLILFIVESLTECFVNENKRKKSCLNTSGFHYGINSHFSSDEKDITEAVGIVLFFVSCFIYLYS